MLKQLFLSVVLLFTLIFMADTAQASSSIELRRANKLLAAKKYQEAYQEYIRIAEKGRNPIAIVTVALFHELGWGRKVDNVQACQWYEKAAELDVPLAVNNLAKCIENNIYQDQDYARAAQLYQKAADLGYHLALCHLGELYLHGKGLEQNSEKGLQLCEQAALKGSVPAMLNIADFNLALNTTRANLSALHWYSVAASYQSAPAQFSLGTMLLEGQGIAQDPLEAREWFEKAAAQGFQPAYYQTARLYYGAPKDPATGLWTEHDLAKSYLWISAALKRSKNQALSKELNTMLNNVKAGMPPTWEANLTQKLETHLAQFPTVVD